MSRRKKRGFQAIDITPLIDVLFMLIIFLVLTTTFSQGRVEVRLPQGGEQGTEQGNAVLLSVTEKGGILWDGNPITLTELSARLKQSKREGQEIRVAGDVAAPYGVVARVLDTLRTHEIDRVALLFEDGRP